MATVSQVDPTVPADNIKADKGLLRKNFQQIYTENTAAIRKNRLGYRIAYGSNTFYTYGN